MDKTDNAEEKPPVDDKPANKRRPVGRPFKKGVSGNPGGKRKMTVVELAKSLSDKAIRELMKIGANSKAAAPARVKALELILDRAWGRPTPVVPVSAVPPPLSYPDEIENARRILFALDLAGRRKREMEVEALPPPVPKDILDEVPPAEVLKPKDDDMAVRFAAAHDVSCLREMSPSSGSPKVVKGRNRRH